MIYKNLSPTHNHTKKELYNMTVCGGVRYLYHTLPFIKLYIRPYKYRQCCQQCEKYFFWTLKSLLWRFERCGRCGQGLVRYGCWDELYNKSNVIHIIDQSRKYLTLLKLQLGECYNSVRVTTKRVLQLGDSRKNISWM